jgi:hypothetical protein
LDYKIKSVEDEIYGFETDIGRLNEYTKDKDFVI